jgi:hypothetical protein
MKAVGTMTLRRRALCGTLALVLAAGVWLPTLHRVFRPAVAEFRVEAGNGLSPLARALAARHLALWEDPAKRAKEIAKMRVSNAEWDFMGRTYLVLALSEMALREPAQRERYLAVMDQIIEETLALEESRGMYFFLMGYAQAAPFMAQPARSTFLDGEIALMLAVRQAVAPAEKYRELLARRIDTVVTYMQQGPVMCGESYPDECWMFCNAVALAAVKVSDYVDGRDHGAFVAKWLATAKAKLLDAKSGMLVSSFTYRGQAGDGPEGSSIWMVAHCLRLADAVFAARQYALARQQLGKAMLGFGYAREWPATWQGPTDVDSGPIVPVVGASAGSSGLAILGAASFGDEAYLRELLTTLTFAGFPMSDGPARSFGASNQVGDAVVLYALVQGPMWARVQEGRR